MGDTLNCIETAKRIVNKKIKIVKSKKIQEIIRESNEILNEYCMN